MSSMLPRRNSVQVNVGGVLVGGGAPVVVQSMTNTDTADIEDTAKQIIELHDAGSELVRITVNNKDAAKAVPYIMDYLDKKNVEVPVIGDFHYNGHVLLTEFPECARALSKYRINPGNTGTKARDKEFQYHCGTGCEMGQTRAYRGELGFARSAVAGRKNGCQQCPARPEVEQGSHD